MGRQRYTHHYINNVQLPLFQTADLFPALLRNNFADVEQFILKQLSVRLTDKYPPKLIKNAEQSTQAFGCRSLPFAQYCSHEAELPP
ncbi:unnamed protein product [Urochloa humidicola]